MPFLSVRTRTFAVVTKLQRSVAPISSDLPAQSIELVAQLRALGLIETIGSHSGLLLLDVAHPVPQPGEFVGIQRPVTSALLNPLGQGSLLPIDVLIVTAIVVGRLIVPELTIVPIGLIAPEGTVPVVLRSPGRGRPGGAIGPVRLGGPGWLIEPEAVVAIPRPVVPVHSVESPIIQAIRPVFRCVDPAPWRRAQEVAISTFSIDVGAQFFEFLFETLALV